MPRKSSKPSSKRPKDRPSAIEVTQELAPSQDGARGEPSLSFPIVAVGASAGGLEPSGHFLRAIPASTGMAFVMIHHLSPGRTSMLAEILSRSTTMPVRTVEDGMKVEPDHVYVIPPGTAMELQDGMLRLEPRTVADGTFRPIDHFFRSLAAQQGYRAIGVVLSGTANDGTAGCEEIKAEGGITFAQDDSAQQESMPKSAIAAGCVDFVLPPEGIAEELSRIAKHPLVAPAGEHAMVVGEDRLVGVLDLVRQQTGMDFSHYKKSTVLRRVARRMVLHKIDEIKEYQRFLRNTPMESEALFNDILINVTSFFRNPEGYSLLKDKVFPEITRERSRHLPVRIWTLGCSTGEEAYSVAVAFSEFSATMGRAIPVQIFASDLSPAGIDKARAGLYTTAIEQDVSPDRLRRFFLEADGGYKVTKSIRDMVVFARHNALVDPPFSHMDLICCRNMLIYLDPVLQQRLVPILHYALNPGGFLWLGTSETVGPYRALFDQVDQKFRLYKRKPAPAQLERFVSTENQPASHPARSEQRPAASPASGSDPQREADRLLLNRYAPPGVLITGDFDILLFRGDTSPYLTPSPGRASLNLLKMLREGLIIGVRAALLKAKREKRPVRQEALDLHSDGLNRKVTVEVIPVAANAVRETSFLVLFDDVQSARDRARPAKAPILKIPRGQQAAAEVIRLRGELGATREYLQSVIEQQEAANEELQSANEEVQSANEELQSINEELETSKEEIQSSSEELATVNDELSNRNHELSQSNNDLLNLINSVQVPIVILGPDFRIRRFTPIAERLLNLIASDIGRPITDIKPNIDLPDLEAQLVQVMDTVTPREISIQDKNGHWYSLRLRPYRTLDNKIDGVVLMLMDIQIIKEAEEVRRAVGDRLAVLHDQAPLGIREVDREGCYTQVNQKYCLITGYTREELIGRRFEEFVVAEDRRRAMEGFRRVMEGAAPFYREEYQHVHKSGRPIWVEVHGFALRDASGTPVSGVAFLQDISERKQADAELRQADRSKNEFLAMLAHELRNPLAPMLNAAQLLGSANMTPEGIASMRQVIDRQVRNLSRMTDDLLDISRISRGRIRLHPEIVDLVTVSQRALDLFRPVMEGRGHVLHVELPGEPLFLEADPVRLEQIIDNLLSNASKFTEDNGQIWFSLRRLPDPAPGVAELVVRDNGRGIPPELVPRVFDPFVQAEQTLDRTRGGLGIGLTLVRHLVQLHQGSVDVRSDGPSRGSEFTVRLPLASEPVGVLPERRKPSQAPRHRKILIVDDNPDAADTLGMLLRHAGHQVSIANEGESAIRIAGELEPDIVLLDMGLPGRDGIEVARELLAQAGGRQIHVIAVSGYGQDELRNRARDVGIDYYFTKPVDIANLARLFAGLS